MTAYLLWEPKEGSVEWHKRKYRETQNFYMNWSRYPRLDSIYRKLTGTSRPVRRLTCDQVTNLQEQMNVSRQALVEAGYLTERTFALSNRSFKVVAHTIQGSSIGVIRRRYPNFTRFNYGSNTLTVVGFAEDMPKWEELVRKADSPLEKEWELTMPTIDVPRTNQ